MFGTVRNKTNLMPLALVLAAVSGVFIAESGLKFANPAFASNILDVASGSSNSTPGAFDLDDLVRIDKKLYNVTVEDYVDLNPMSSATVKKISAGHVFNVNIATTSTGTYSTDSMQSKHVLYPGINVEEVSTSPLAETTLIIVSKLQGRELLKFIQGLDDFAASDDEGCSSLGSYIGCK